MKKAGIDFGRCGSRRGCAGVAIAVIAGPAIAGSGLPLPTTSDDFFQHGTQPLMSGFMPPVTSGECSICHSNFDLDTEPVRQWSATMLAQSARDPVFWAALAVANQDAENVGELCIRCHVPGAFLNGRHQPADGSAITTQDREGVACAICHRMVDPVYKPGVSPARDEDILLDLDALGLLPVEGGNARYILDPVEVRRGPYGDIPFNPHFGTPTPENVQSPFHRSSELCWNCHDVSNPVFVRNDKDGSYDPVGLGAEHPTGSQFDMFPLHRTYQEWLNSYYKTQGGVQHNGRFGGNHPTGVMEVCQDCHMPDQEGMGCNLPAPPFFARPDIGQHSFAGSNTWVIGAIRNLFPDSQTGLSAELVQMAHDRNVLFLEAASDLVLTQTNSSLKARVINQSGHKLPTGFTDGRRIWINVKFLDGQGDLMEERGAYDFDTATLVDHGDDTTVFEGVMGLDADAAAATGLPEGPTFHFVLANTILKDNRIPPRGHSNNFHEEMQTAPIGATYGNGQYWSDTFYQVPLGARQVVVTVYHQVTSREFIEFLRDANTTNTDGQIAYDEWLAGGMSLPTPIDVVTLDLVDPADIDGDGIVGFNDLLLVLTNFGPCPTPPFECPFDVNSDGTIDFNDVLFVLASWTF